MSPEIAAWMDGVPEGHRATVLAVRELVLGLDPGVREGLKWNAGSFRQHDDFATFNLKDPDAVRLILHAGAKKRSNPLTVGGVPDPEALLTWLGDDRAMLVFPDADEVDARRGALEALLRAWMAAVAPVPGRRSR